jgi:hypothetical protein
LRHPASLGQLTTVEESYETNWLAGIGWNFSIRFRAYWQEQGILDGTWKPPVVTIA